MKRGPRASRAIFTIDDVSILFYVYYILIREELQLQSGGQVPVDGAITSPRSD